MLNSVAVVFWDVLYMHFNASRVSCIQFLFEWRIAQHSVRKPSERMSNFWMVRFSKNRIRTEFRFPHITSILYILQFKTFKRTVEYKSIKLYNKLPNKLKTFTISALECLGSGNASQHILRWSPSTEIARVVVERTSGIKIPWRAWLGLLSLSSLWLLHWGLLLVIWWEP